MRFATASTLASFALLIPFELHAFENAPESKGPPHEVLREIAEPPLATRFLPSAVTEFQDALDADPSDGDVQSTRRTISADDICNTVASAATAHDIPVLFFLRLIWQESRFDPSAISHAGAQGIAQFMPRVASSMGLEDPFDPLQALPTSARFLSALHEQFGNIGLAAAAYNAGARRVQNWLAKRGKLPQETRDYVVKITGLAPERWAKSAPDELELKRPPAPCAMPDSAVVRSVRIPMPPPRPGDLRVASGELKSSEISAASKPREAPSANVRRLRRPTPPSRGKSVMRREQTRSADAKAIRLALQTRAGAQELCGKLKRAGGSCMVLRAN